MTRTCDLRFRKPPLYPAELRDRKNPHNEKQIFEGFHSRAAAQSEAFVRCGNLRRGNPGESRFGQKQAGAGPGRFARDAAEYATATGVRLQVLDGGSDPAGSGRP